MPPAFRLKCKPCGTTHTYESLVDKNHHKRNVTKQVISTYYAKSPGSTESTLHTIFRAADGAFKCIRCEFSTMNSESMRKHPKNCYGEGPANIPPPQALPSSSSAPSAPLPSPTTPLISSSSPALSILFDTGPLSTPASSLMSPEVSTSACESLGSQSIQISLAPLPSISFSSSNALDPNPIPLPSLLFSSSSTQLHQTVAIAPPPGPPVASTSAPTVPPPPATPSTSPLPIPVLDRDLALDLKDALTRLPSTCILCWMRHQPCSHGLWDCSHNQLNRYGTSADERYRDFRDSINCSANTHCYGCYIPQRCRYLNNSRSSRFHPWLYGRNHCQWRDTLLPLAYLVFISPSIRKLFSSYTIPGIDFASASQAEFISWFMNTNNPDRLPPSLFILYVVKNAFGMPPPVGGPVHDDPFA